MRPFTGDGLEDLAEMLAVDKDMKTLLISEYQNPKEHILVPFLSAFVYYGDVIDGLMPCVVKEILETGRSRLADSMMEVSDDDYDGL